MEAVLSPKPSDAESAEVLPPTHNELCQRLHAIVEAKKHERLGLMKPIPLVLNGVGLVHRTSDGYIDATSMCQAMNVRKNIQAWYRNQSTQNFLTELSKHARILACDLVIIGDKSREHTWVHRMVAYHLAMWLSPTFAVQVYRWLDELAICGKVKLYAEKSTEEIESIYMTQLANADRQLTQLSTENEEARLAICAKDAELAALKSFDAQEAARLAVLVQQQFNIETYKRAQVVYLIYLGYFKAPGDTVERHWFKLGQSDRAISDEKKDRTRILEHYRTFGKDISIIKIVRVAISSQVEARFLQYLTEHNIKQWLTDRYGDKHKECFATRDGYSIINLIGVFEDMAAASFNVSELEVVNASLSTELSIRKEELADSRAELNRLKERVISAALGGGLPVCTTTSNIQTQTDAPVRTDTHVQTGDTEVLAAPVQSIDTTIPIPIPEEDISEPGAPTDEGNNEDADDANDIEDAPATEDGPQLPPRTCTDCKELKEDAAFKYGDRYRGVCHECRNKKRRAEYEHSDTQIAQRMRETIELKKQDLQKCRGECGLMKRPDEFYATGPASRCKECVKKEERAKRAAEPATARALLTRANKQEVARTGRKKCAKCTELKNASTEFGRGNICKVCRCAAAKQLYLAKKGANGALNNASS